MSRYLKLVSACLPIENKSWQCTLRPTFNPLVDGSNPSRPTKFKLGTQCAPARRRAGSCRIWILSRRGSNPSRPTNSSPELSVHPRGGALVRAASGFCRGAVRIHHGPPIQARNSVSSHAAARWFVPHLDFVAARFESITAHHLSDRFAARRDCPGMCSGPKRVTRVQRLRNGLGYACTGMRAQAGPPSLAKVRFAPIQ
jgi:hypothetical protein